MSCSSDTVGPHYFATNLPRQVTVSPTLVHELANTLMISAVTCFEGPHGGIILTSYPFFFGLAGVAKR